MLLLLLVPLVASSAGRGQTDAYTIDNQPVLLYKIIQWWYDAASSEAAWFCGRTLAYRSRDVIQVDFAPEHRRLSLRFEIGFAELMSVVDPQTTTRSLDLRAVRLDPNYVAFARGKFYSGNADQSAHLWIEAVTADQADRMMALASELVVTLSGPIRGLVDGRIAITDHQVLIQPCPQSASAATASPTLTIALRHRPAEAVMAIFATAPAGSDDGP